MTKFDFKNKLRVSSPPIQMAFVGAIIVIGLGTALAAGLLVISTLLITISVLAVIGLIAVVSHRVKNSRKKNALKPQIGQSGSQLPSKS